MVENTRTQKNDNLEKIMSKWEYHTTLTITDKGKCAISTAVGNLNTGAILVLVNKEYDNFYTANQVSFRAINKHRKSVNG